MRKENSMSKELIDAITEMREEDVQSITDKLLASGTNPVAILDACREAMAVIGQRFEAGDCFVPELILAGEMLGQVSAKVKPHLQAQAGGQKKLGRVVIGTVEGDIHDIGKDIVTFMLDVNGFEVRDLGVDVPAARFIEEVKAFQPQVVGLSGFLTLAYDPMKNTVQALKDAGLRDGVKIMIGGGQIDDQIRQYTGADAYGKDAMAAVTLAKSWVGG
jgi:5-methyltetrahydrofolate--homocysteine methyltransferase